MKKKKRFIIGVIFAAFLTLFLFTSLKLFQKQKSFYSLGETIAKEAEKESIEYSLLIKDLTFPRANIGHRDNEQVPAASLLKVPILAVIFQAIEEKKLSLDDSIVIERKDIAGGSGKLKAFKLPYSLKLRELIDLMISVSDNTATNKVINLLGFDYINATFKELGLSETTLSRRMMDFSKRKLGVENYTTASDITIVLEKIYDKKLISKELSELALKLLKKQKVNDRIPRYLPKEIIVAHKTGLERGVVHDAGIVFTPGGNYIICVLVETKKGYRKAKKFIAQTSLLAYNLYK